MPDGGCHCGTIRYRIARAPDRNAVCHCSDCRRCAGAAGVAWAAVPKEMLAVLQGETKIYRSSPGEERHFCPDCGTGLFFFSEEMLPGIADIQLATLDTAADFAPTAHIQMADALPWEFALHDLPQFERFPG